MMAPNCRAGLLTGLISLVALQVAPAHAQHVVTDAEASKLTFAALTAPPPPPRPAYRAYYRPAMAIRHLHGRAHHERYAVSRASYHIRPTAHARHRHR